MSATKTAEELYTGTVDLRSARVGDQVGSLAFTVSSEMMARNAWANDDYHPWYVEDSPYGGRIVSPVYLAAFDARLFYGYYAYPEGGSLFAKQEFEYLRPLLADVEYVMEGTLAEIYERKGRTFYRLAIVVRDGAGVEHLRMLKTIAWPVRARAIQETP